MSDNGPISWQVIREDYYHCPEWQGDPDWDHAPRIPGNQLVIVSGTTQASFDDVVQWRAADVGISVRESDALIEMPLGWVVDVYWLQVEQDGQWITLRSIMPNILPDVDFDCPPSSRPLRGSRVLPPEVPISPELRRLGWRNR